MVHITWLHISWPGRTKGYLVRNSASNANSLSEHQNDKRSCTKQSPTEYNFFQISDEWTHLEFTQEKKWIWSCLLFFMCYTGMHEVMWSWFEDGILHSNILQNRYSWVQEKGKEGKANRSFHETCFFKEKKRPLERFLFYGMSK